MKEQTYWMVKGMLSKDLPEDEILKVAHISKETLGIIKKTGTPEECKRLYFSNKAKQGHKKRQTESKEERQDVIVTANAYMVDLFNEQKRLLEQHTAQMSTLICEVKAIVKMLM